MDLEVFLKAEKLAEKIDKYDCIVEELEKNTNALVLYTEGTSSSSRDYIATLSNHEDKELLLSLTKLIKAHIKGLKDQFNAL